MVIKRPWVVSCLVGLALAAGGCSGAAPDSGGGAAPVVSSGGLVVARGISVSARQLADADPCALIDRHALAALGTATLGLHDNLRSCEAEFGAASGVPVSVSVEFAPRPDGAPRAVRLEHGVPVLGGSPAGDRSCSRSVVAATDAVLTITAGDHPGSTWTACRIADRAIDGAVSRLLHGGLPAAHYPATSLARQDACRLVARRDADRVPGINRRHRYGGYRGQYCQWGDGPVSRPGLYIGFELSQPLTAGAGWRAVTVAGRHAFVRSTAASRYAMPACAVQLVNGRAYRPSFLGDDEVIDVEVRAGGPAKADCALATALTAKAVGGLGRAG